MILYNTLRVALCFVSFGVGLLPGMYLYRQGWLTFREDIVFQRGIPPFPGEIAQEGKKYEVEVVRFDSAERWSVKLKGVIGRYSVRVIPMHWKSTLQRDRLFFLGEPAGKVIDDDGNTQWDKPILFGKPDKIEIILFYVGVNDQRTSTNCYGFAMLSFALSSRYPSNDVQDRLIRYDKRIFDRAIIDREEISQSSRRLWHAAEKIYLSEFIYED